MDLDLQFFETNETINNDSAYLLNKVPLAKNRFLLINNKKTQPQMRDSVFSKTTK